MLLRLIGKWLKAGVMEEGAVRRPSSGTPQGGVISPLLANLYLHEVFDRWFEDVVRPRLRGGARVVRYADDIAIAFTDEHDARRVLDVLPKRLGKYGLRLHPDKTKLVDFRRPPHDPARGGGRGPTRTRSFTLLGFTHYWARNREGFWVVKRKTAKDRLRRSLRRVWVWCRDHRHSPVVEQHQTLARMLRGHYAYFGITGNAPSLGAFCPDLWEPRGSDPPRPPDLTTRSSASPTPATCPRRCGWRISSDRRCRAARAAGEHDGRVRGKMRP